ncbi:L-gulonolactone oxidase 2-like [Triticum dicoccoides]|uniref:L-gulonolactone oxidase 2-like n=1 Tax=Triticum dicoccoides TaxID=85692 RepID=UPI0018909F8B|nr:L-gulonolactone oxidase 2-like [Triticum dicoccoides]
MELLATLLAGLLLLHLAGSSPPPAPVVCARGTSDCTVTNAYGSFLDRATCRAANVVYPRTEAELVAAVAAAAAAKRKLKVATRYSHSFPKLACPGGRDGTIISTLRLNGTVRLDVAARLITVESGVVLQDLLRAAAAAGLALPHSPYWSGVTVGGLLATGAHGSSLWGKGGAVHEHVVGLRIVTPAPASRGFAVVRELGDGHPDLDAAKVSLGVLGVVSQVTLALQPLFKRSVTFVERDDADLEDQVAEWGRLHEFGDVAWQPGRGKVVYRQDDRVDVSSPGDGVNDHLVLRPRPALGRVEARRAEELLEENATDVARCAAAAAAAPASQPQPHGFTNDGEVFTGYPVVGYQHRMQATGACIDCPEDGLLTSCKWDPRLGATFIYNSAISVPLRNAAAFVADVKRLRDLNPRAFCSLDARGGLLARYIRASSAHLGKPEDAVDFDLAYYRSYTAGAPRAHADVIDELEQMALRKYGGLPHWGKNRNFAFDGAVGRYPKAGEFLEVKGRYDPNGLFSSEWSDQVLGINGTSPRVDKEGCAMEGLCVCSDDSHCAPERGYLCRPGKVYTEARVCSSSFPPAAGALRDEL